MHQKPLLSIIITFRNQRDVIEPTLGALYGMNTIPFELFVMEDGSDDGSGNAIQSLLDYYQHEQTYYFEHSQVAGRGSCLNEALQQCNASIIWTPESADDIDETQLKNTVLQLQDSKFAYACGTSSLPTSSKDWIGLIGQGSWPADGNFLWNLSRIPFSQQFFSPFLESYQAAELAARISASFEGGYTDPWYTPSGAGKAGDISPADRAELAYALLRTHKLPTKQRKSIYSLLDQWQQVQSPQPARQSSESLMAEARHMKQEGRLNAALELIEHILTKEPDHQQAKQIKIKILERKRRFVEASELKHEMNASEKPQQPPREVPAGEIKTSIIIPTALYGKPALEHCLVSVSEHCDPQTTELIIIDNASLDDTHDYLSELRDKRFFNCSVITNKQNAGFAASVNQGLEKARGQYACIMHNDVEFTGNALHRLEELMDNHTDFAIVGPLSTETLNPAQSADAQTGPGGPLVSAEYLDSFCMMVRTDAGLRMDEKFQLAFFEDIDLCFQARAQGHKVGIATDVTVQHHFGTTTFALNLDTESDEYWKNASYFNDKWDIDTFSEEELKSKSRFDQLLTLDSIVNPLYPEDEVTAWFEQLFTDEVKTEILKTDHDPDTLCQLVHLMMVMDQRDVMRRLEDRLDGIELPASLTYQLVQFYFNRNIYSRCVHYLDRLTEEQQSIKSELYKLEVLVNEKEFEAAVPKLKELLNRAPSNPILYKLAGDIHQFEGNEEEASSFYQIAHQLNPFDYSPEGVEELRLRS